MSTPPSISVALALLLYAHSAGADSLNIDFGITYEAPSASYGAAAAQAGTWNIAGLGVTPLLDLTGMASNASVNVISSSEMGNTAVLPVNDDQLLLNDNFFSSTGVGWSADLAGLAAGDYDVYLYVTGNRFVVSGDMTVGGVAVASIPGDQGATLIEGTSWVSVEVTVSNGTLPISGISTTFSGLAGLQIVPLPEPGSSVLLVSGSAWMMLLGWSRRRRHLRAQQES